MDDSKRSRAGQTDGKEEHGAGRSELAVGDRPTGAVEHDEPQAAAGHPATGGGLLEKRGTKALAGWWLPAYAFVLGLISVGLAPDTGFWWLVPLFGLATLVALAALNRSTGREKERELMEAIHQHGALIPATAALRTSLTVDEAARMLEELSEKGYLQPRAEDGAVAYALHERDWAGSAPTTSMPARPKPEDSEAPQTLDEPLSGRELEVLNLLSSGRTNPEIASELFVSVGTVKSHANNIYRKLEVRNRTEALTRARKLKLLP